MQGLTAEQDSTLVKKLLYGDKLRALDSEVGTVSRPGFPPISGDKSPSVQPTGTARVLREVPRAWNHACFNYNAVCLSISVFARAVSVTDLLMQCQHELYMLLFCIVDKFPQKCFRPQSI